MGFVDSIMQNIRNKHLSDRAIDQVKEEETRTDKAGEIPQLVEQVAQRLLKNGDTPPWVINGADKPIRMKGTDDLLPGYYIAGQQPKWFVFLTLTEQKQGILVHKPDFYHEEVMPLNLNRLSYAQQSAIVLGLKQILDIKDEDFKTLPHGRWSWQVK